MCCCILLRKYPSVEACDARDDQLKLKSRVHKINYFFKEIVIDIYNYVDAVQAAAEFFFQNLAVQNGDRVKKMNRLMYK